MLRRLATYIILIVLTSAATAYAGYGVHRSIDASSSACTGCHRAHAPITQQGFAPDTAALIADETTEYEFCITCHGPDATGADTDIVYGVYKNADSTYGTYNEALNGGGFTKVGGMAGPSVTSTHAMDGGVYPVFGSSTGASLQMSCTGCHDPDGSSNYRLLRNVVNGKDVSNYVSSNEKGFSTESPTMPKTPKEFDTYEPNYTKALYKKPADPAKGLSGWCASCHDQYLSPGNTYTDSEGRKRFHHSVNARMGNNPDKITVTDLPVGKASASTPDNNPENYIECLTCHLAHGTVANMTNNARVEPTRSAAASGPGYSTLLRQDNRGICQECHNK